MIWGRNLDYDRVTEMRARSLGARLRQQAAELGRSCGNCAHALLNLGECAKVENCWGDNMKITAESVACDSWKDVIGRPHLAIVK